MAIENFNVGTLIIPMDTTYQNMGMFRAYGLVYRLLSNNIPVKWSIRSGKTFNGTDFTASATDFQSGAIITNHNYTGGPFIIDSTFAAIATPLITSWQSANPNVKVHISTASFSADIAATMQRPPRIAVEASNSGIVTAYLNAAGIPDSNGNIWSSASPGVLSETEIAAGALFGYDLTACRRNAYDILISPHTGTGVWDDPGLKLELNDWLRRGGFLHAMCASIPSIENEAGPFLTQTGIPETDTNKGDTGTFTVDLPDFPTVQAVNTTASQGLPGGSFQTIYHNTPGLIYNSQTQIIAHFVQNSTGKKYDFIMAGPYKNGAGAGKIIYEGGHQYSTSLPYTGNMENMYTRFVLDDIFFSVGKPLMYLNFNTGNPNNEIFVGQNNTITFSIANTGASPALNTSFSVTLTPGIAYNNDATIPPTSIVGSTLTWSSAALGNVTPGNFLTFTADFTPIGVGSVQLATFSTSFGDENNENFSLNNACIKTTSVSQQRPILDVVKNVDKDFATYGDTLTYTVNMVNNGNVTATNVVFVDPIPAGSTFVPGSVTINGNPVLGDPSVGIPLPDIPPSPAPGSTVVVTFQVIVNNMTTPSDVVNHAQINYIFTVDGTTYARTIQSNTVVTVIRIGKLTLIKSTDKSVAAIGDIITYTIEVNNTGNTTAFNTTFFDNPPAGTNFIPGTVFVNGVNMPGANPIIGILIGDIAPETPDGNEHVTVSFQVEVTSIPVPPTATNTANATFLWRVNLSDQPNIPGNGASNPVETQIVNAEITITKSEDIAFAKIGDVITYTALITNSGDITSNNVVFTDNPPAGTSFVPNSLTIDGFPNTGNPSLGIPLGNMIPGSDITVTFQVTATSVPSPNPTTNISVVNGSFLIEPSEPPRTLNFESNPVDVTIEQIGINVIKSVDKSFAEVGETLTYTVTVNNMGSVPANNGILTDIMPNGTTFVPGTVTINNAPSGANPNAGIPIPSIPAGGSVDVTFQVTLDNIPTPNPAVNTATFEADFPINPNAPLHLSFESNLVSTRAEIALVEVNKAVNEAFAEVGDILTYTIVMNNIGTVPANNTVLTDVVPSGTTFVPGTVTINGAPSGANPAFGIPVGNISSGGLVTVTFQAQVTSIPVPNPAINIGTMSAKYPVNPQNPITKEFPSNPVSTQVETAGVNVVKIVDKAFAEVGDVLTYNVTITNPGTVPATNVLFTDVMPSGINFIPGTVTVNGLPSAGSPVAGILLADIPAGGMTTIAFQATVVAIPVPNPAENISVINALYPVNPQNPTPKTTESNPAITQVVVVDINAVKTADKEFVEVGETLTYTVVITNNGTVTVDNVIFKDTPPVGTTFIPNSFRINGILQPGANPSIGVNIGSISPGGSKTVSFRVTVDVLPPGGTITNIANINFEFKINPSGPVKTRNEPSNPVNTQVELVKLQVIKDVDKTVAVVGDKLTYTVTIANTGTTTAMDVVFKDEIPDGTSLVVISVIVNGVAQPNMNPETGIPIGNILPGDFATVAFSVLVEERPEPPEIVNVAIVDYKIQINPEGPIEDRTEESPSIVTQIVVVELLAIKTADKNDVNVGDVLTYTIAITNTGTVSVENVIFKDQVPEGTKLVANSLTVRGDVIAGANPSFGVTIGIIQPGETVLVRFSVVIETIPCPPELENKAVITFDYRLESNEFAIKRQIESNEVITDVGLRTFKQLNINENLTIPNQKPDAEELMDTFVNIEITATRIIETPIVTSYEGQKLTGWKVIVEGKLIQTVVYIANEPSQSIHAAEFNVPFSTFIVLPNNFRSCQKIRVLGYIEDVYAKMIDSRTIFKNVTIRIEGILNCN